MMQFDQERPKVVSSLESEKYAVTIIDFLEARTVWEDVAVSAEATTVLVAPRNDAGEIICMINLIHNFLEFFEIFLCFSDVAKAKEGLKYFLQYANGEIAIMATDDATISHPQLVLHYLEDNIA